MAGLTNQEWEKWHAEHDNYDVSWNTIHDILVRIWNQLYENEPMPSGYSEYIIKNLDMNFKVLYYDLTRILERVSRFARPGFRGYFVTLAELEAVDSPMNGDFAWVSEIVPPSTIKAVWIYDEEFDVWVDTGDPIPDFSPIQIGTDIPLMDSDKPKAGTEAFYAPIDHQHPTDTKLLRLREALQDLTDPDNPIDQIVSEFSHTYDLFNLVKQSMVSGNLQKAEFAINYGYSNGKPSMFIDVQNSTGLAHVRFEVNTDGVFMTDSHGDLVNVCPTFKHHVELNRINVGQNWGGIILDPSALSLPILEDAASPITVTFANGARIEAQGKSLVYTDSTSAQKTIIKADGTAGDLSPITLENGATVTGVTTIGQAINNKSFQQITTNFEMLEDVETLYQYVELRESGGGEGTVVSVDGVEPDPATKDVELFVDVTEEEIEAMKADPTLAKAGVKYVIFRNNEGYEVNNLLTMGPPDYSNMETINRIPTNNGTWKADRNGYVYCLFDNDTYNNVSMYFYVNNKTIAKEFGTSFGATFAVKKDDIVKIYANGPLAVTEIYGCYYIPPVINPPVYLESAPLLDYSTIEQDTGRKWINGKTIYQRTVNYNGSLPFSTFQTVIDFGNNNYYSSLLDVALVSINGPWYGILKLNSVNQNGRYVRVFNTLNDNDAIASQSWNVTASYTK